MATDTNTPTTDTKHTVHLEVQGGTSSSDETIWHDAGPISLLDEETGASTATATAAQHNGANKRQQLPKTVKNLLTDASNLSKEERKQVYLYRHAPNNGPNTNLMILLHGAGDTHVPYDKLARTMALPQTATLALHASKFFTLPLGLGHSWFHEMNYNTGQPLQPDDMVDSLDSAVEKLCSVLQALTSDATGWIAERIFLFGYGAGACLAMETCVKWYQNQMPALGGAVCVAGGLLLTTKRDKETMSPKQQHVKATPTLIMTGSNNESFPPVVAKKIQRVYDETCAGQVQLHIQPGKDQAMISSPQEMKAVMEFLSERLVRYTQMGNNNLPTTG